MNSANNNILPDKWTNASLEEINFKKSETIDPSKNPDESFELYSVPSFEYRQPEVIDGKEIGSTKQIVDVDDVLICKINPRINRVWIVSNSKNSKKIASSEWIVINSKGFINSDYLRYVFSAPFFRLKLNSEVSGVGGSLTRARPKLVKDYKIPLAPLNEQNRIVEKLDALFAKIDSIKDRMETIPEQIKQIRQSVLHATVTGKLTEEWRENKKIDSWRQTEFKEIVKHIQAGKNFSCPEIPVTDNEVGLVKISAVTWGEFDSNETKTVTDAKRIDPKLLIQTGDFLISRANTIELVGASVVVKDIKYKIMLSDKVWRVTFQEDIVPEYIDYFLKSRIGREEIESRATGNQHSMRNISQNAFKSINIHLPSKDEQYEIVAQINKLFNRVKKVELKLSNIRNELNELPQSLLFKAFKGELVAQDPNDEPAEKLLEKIFEEKTRLEKKVRKFKSDSYQKAAEPAPEYKKK